MQKKKEKQHAEKGVKEARRRWRKSSVVHMPEDLAMLG
jgi:hypothetical protein